MAGTAQQSVFVATGEHRRADDRLILVNLITDATSVPSRRFLDSFTTINVYTGSIRNVGALERGSVGAGKRWSGEALEQGNIGTLPLHTLCGFAVLRLCTFFAPLLFCVFALKKRVCGLQGTRLERGLRSAEDHAACNSDAQTSHCEAIFYY